MSDPRNLRVVLLFATFGNEYANEALTWLSAFSKRLFSSDFDLIFRADNQSDNPLFQNPGSSLLRGNNFAADFSAWDACIAEYLKFQMQPEDVLIFANDSFHRNFGTGVLRYFLKFGESQLLESLEKGVVGIVDDFPKKVEVLGVEGQRWVRSNFFFIKAKHLHLIFPLSVPELATLRTFGTAPGESFFKTEAKLSENYQSYMQRWLFGEFNPKFPEYSITWFKSEPLTEINRPAFQRKMTAILSEHSMSFRACAAGLELINVNPLPWPDGCHDGDIYEVHKQIFEPLKLEELS